MTKKIARPVFGAVRVRACAKINLSLRILGTRADGYHELRTTYQSLALHDTLTFTATDGPFEIIADDPECPRDRTNLVWMAAEGLWRIAGFRGALAGVRVQITKRIPAAAGLGGGSSDAASALRALRALWGLTLHDDCLADLAALIGADAPFFLTGGTALGLERGEVLYRLEEEPPAWVVIARPDFGVSTRNAYAWWDAANAHGAPGMRQAITATGCLLRANDLQAPVAARHPDILKVVRRLEGLGARYAAMSGSGSAVFGLFEAKRAAEAAARAATSRVVRTWLTRTTSRRQHARLSAVEPLAR
jgi:4-diphosphocytidyl-2-C-methyl-D-erythritol kinase